MTSRERADRAMRGGLADRVPVVPLIDTSYAAACCGVPVAECFLNPVVHARALVSTLERHPGIDGFSINIGLTREVIAEQAETATDYFITTVDGTAWQVPKNDIGTPTARAITRFDDARLEHVDVLRPHIVETLKAIPAEILRDYDVSAGLTGPFSELIFMMGIERVLIAMHEEPAALRRAIELRVPFALRWANEMCALGVPSVWIGEGLASSSLISPRQYEEFVLPYEQCITARLREHGVPSVLHICGKSTGILDAVARSGADCFEIDWQVDLAEAKTRIGTRMALKGNLHTTALVQAAPDRIYEEARQAIRKAGAGGGFILSSGCALGRDTPPANVDAMVRAAREHCA